MKANIFVVIIALVSLTSGCASYRTNTDIEFQSADIGDMKPAVPIEPTDLSSDNYTIIEHIVAIVKKLTVFHEAPTKEQANIVLGEIAKEKGADAVVNVEYKSGVGMDTWGYMEAEGDAVTINK